MNTKHTPGPWAVAFETDVYSPSSPDGKLLVAQTDVSNFIPYVEKAANAQLIAAAPETKAQRDELLAACKALVEAFTAGTSQQHIYRLAAIRAITKAEGKI